MNENKLGMKLLELLANTTRMRILVLLLEAPLTVNSICEALDLKQPRVSNSLKYLREWKLVQSERVGNRRIYSIDKEVSSLLRALLGKYEKLASKVMEKRGINPGRQAIFPLKVGVINR